MRKSEIDFSKQVSVEELHRVMLHILQEIDAICREENIRYFLIDGTLLGAVRHGGFIPWDDDADIAMPRQDFERFCEIAQEKLGDRYFLQTDKTDPRYTLFHIPAKVRDNHSTFIECYGDQYHQGIYVDIFPVDTLSVENAEKELRQKKIIHLLSVLKAPIEFRNFPSLHFFARLAIQLIGRLVPRKCIKKYIEKVKAANRSGTPSSQYTYGMETPWSCRFSQEDLFPLKTMNFESIPFFVPHHPDAILTTIYGDYMVIPPKEQQHTHAKFFCTERLFDKKVSK